MSSDDRSSHSITVVKIGGSVLTDTAAYERVARFLRSRVRGAERPRIVAVVSAQHGHTDDLLGAAQSIVRRPNPVMLDLLWSTGELRSVALLVFHFEDPLRALAAADDEADRLEKAVCEALAAAARFLGFDSLVVPSARSPARHLIVFLDETTDEGALTVLETEPIDWDAWRQRHRR